MPDSSKSWYIADPIHQFVEFGDNQDVVKALVATQPFQRMRRISQLGLASFVFPGAVHSRFSHSLGAAHLAGRLAVQLGVDASQARTLVCAALLHDIGHGPFSHSFEHALKHVLPNRPTHEQWTQTITTELLAGILKSHGVDASAVCNLISAAPDDVMPPYLSQVISSQLDVDRMDYLCRDAHFTGVPIGRIDLDYLIRNIRIIDHGAAGQSLGLTAKGVSSYETFAFARHMMTETVYFHRKVATFESMMEEVIRLLVQCTAMGYEPELVSALRDAREGQSPELAKRLLPAYVNTTEDHLWTAITASAKRSDRLGQLSRMLLERTPVRSVRVAKDKYEILEKALRKEGIKTEQCRVRILPRRLYKQEGRNQVYVQGIRDERPEHIATRSKLLSVLGNQVETEALLVVFDETITAKAFSVANSSFCLERGSSPPPRPPVNAYYREPRKKVSGENV